VYNTFLSLSFINKNLNMKKIILLLSLIQSFFVFSQNMYKIEYSYADKNGFTCNSILFTNNKEAVFKIYDTRSGGVIDLADGRVDNVENDELSKFFYANNELSYARTIIYDREILYSDKYDDKINWVIQPEIIKKIGNYNCTKAKMTINGRAYTVWFTFDVPVNFGPLKMHRLPGLVVEVNAENDFVLIKLKSVSKTKNVNEFNKYKNYFLKSKSVISYPDYEKKVIDAEITSRASGQAWQKKQNLKNGTDYKMSFEDNVTADGYLELPSNFMSEMKKCNGK
jgi:GLPGLI family protein